MAKKNAFLSLVICLLVLALASPCQSQLLTDNLPTFMISDGVHGVQQQPNHLFLSDIRCEQPYGFLPCTNTTIGNVFVVLTYGYLMVQSSKLLSDGIQILLRTPSLGSIGGLVLYLLNFLPNAAIILASGLSGSTETAQSDISIGLGLMAGSTVLFLTFLWGSCLIAGKCDIEDSKVVDFKDTRTSSLTGSGVTTDTWTSYEARIMLISVIPFIIVQLPQIFSITSQSQLPVLVSLIVSIGLLFTYCLYQVLQPWIQKRRVAYANYNLVESRIMENLERQAFGKPFLVNGQPNEDVLQKLFETLDENSDGYLTAAELKAFIIGIGFEELEMDIDDAVDQVLVDLDMSGDSLLDLDEFVNGISNWLAKAKQSAKVLSNGHNKSQETTAKFHQNDESKWHATIKPVLMLLVGSVLAAVLADPLVDSVAHFSRASSIPPFFVSFLILPFLSSTEMLSDLINASRRKSSKSAALAYSQIYGSVAMNNVLCSSLFLGLVYFLDLSWNFSSGAVVILTVCILMGLIASFCTIFPIWLSLIAYALYPFSLLLAYVFDYAFGWA